MNCWRMPERWRRVIGNLTFAACAAAGSASTAVAGECEAWLPGDGPPGVVGSGTVLASTIWDADGDGPQTPWVIFGGLMEGAGDLPVSSVAAWDGQTWHAIGDGLKGWPVPALTVYNGELIAAAGNNSFGGTGPANGVAKWNGTSWEALSAAGFQNVVWALTVFEGELYAGGSFSSAGGTPANNIARWDGASWEAVGAGLSGGVKALTVFDGDLLAGTSNGVRRWDSRTSTWQTFGATLTGNVTSFTTYEGALIAGGNFQSTAGGAQEEVARWNGATWETLGNMNDGVSTLAEFNGELFAGGIFTLVEGQSTNRMARWDGVSWSPMPANGFGMPVRACATLAVLNGDLYAGGATTKPSGLQAAQVGRWDSIEWSYLGDGIDGVVYDVESFHEELIVGGWFSTAGDVVANGIARRDQNGQWHSMGGVSGGSGYVFELAVYNDVLIATGSFNTIGGVGVPGIAQWDGKTWQPFGDVAVGRMLVHEGELYAPGSFGVNKDVAKWNPDLQEWEAIGTFPANAGALALTIFEGDLIAGGIGGAGVNSSAWRWDFDNPGIWQPIGQHLGFSTIQVMGVYDGQLLAGGYSDSFGGPPGGLARLDGNTWVPFEGGFFLGNDNPDEILGVFDLRIFDDELVVAGTFSFAGNQQYSIDGVEANHVVRWNGKEWLALESELGIGTNDAAVVLHQHEDELVIGGWFDAAGGAPNGHYATWAPSCDPASVAGDIDEDGDIDGADLGLLLSAWGPCPDCPADLNDDGEVNGADLGTLLSAWSA
jgi:trimeric autotransporter adhesin